MAKAKKEEIKKIEKIQRSVHYYVLKAKFKEDFERNETKHNTNIQALLSLLTVLVKKKNLDRYQIIGEKSLFINELTFESKGDINTIKGKLLCIRKDLFPQFINMGNDELRDLEAKEEEGIVETTHFIIKEFNKDNDDEAKICIEYNQFGGRINDLKFYLEAIGRKHKMIEGITFDPIIRKSLAAIKNRIGEISKITMRLQSENLDALKNVSDGVYTNLAAAHEYLSEDTVYLELKYDLFGAKRNPLINNAVKAKNIVLTLINNLISKKTEIEKFDTLEVLAQDSDKNGRLNAFDLLIDKVKDTLKVEKKEKSRIIVSLDMFEKIEDSWRKLKI